MKLAVLLLFLNPCYGDTDWMWETNEGNPSQRENNSRLFFIFSNGGHGHGHDEHYHHRPCKGLYAILSAGGHGCTNTGFNPGGDYPTAPSNNVPNTPPGTTEATNSTTTTFTTTTTTTTATTTVRTTATSTTATTTKYVVGPILVPATVSNCTCVEAYRCDPADVHFFGSGLIDPRRLCIAGDVCCTRPKPSNVLPPVPRPTPAPYLSGCGISNPEGVGIQITPKVLSNTNTAFAEFPWMAALLEVVMGGKKFVCGGSLIHPLAVLTAAHCLQNKAAETLLVRLGEWDAASTNELYQSQEITAQSVILHPNFYSGGLFNDVAVIILSEAADISRPNIQLSCLPAVSDLYHLNKCVTIGWGKQSFNDPGFSAILKKTTVPVVPHSACQPMLQSTRLGNQFRLHESFICAGQTGMDACIGDGGGPLFCPLGDQPQRYIQVGIVSWGVGCGTSPGVYTDLTQFEHWVQTTVDANTSPIVVA